MQVTKNTANTANANNPYKVEEGMMAILVNASWFRDKSREELLADLDRTPHAFGYR